MDESRKYLALVSDLMFSGKISAEARAAGANCRIVRAAAKLSEAGPADLLLVDLTMNGAIPAAIAWKSANSKPIIGFAPHVDEAIISQAQAGGFDQVLSRGKFVQVLPAFFQIQQKEELK